MAIHSTFELTRGIMNGLKMKITCNELITKVKQWFTGFFEDDMIFSEVKEMRLIKKLQRRLERSKMRVYNH